MPMLPGNKKLYFWNTFFVNCFIGTPEDSNCIALLYRWSSDTRYIKFEKIMKSVEFFKRRYDPSPNYVMFVFNIPMGECDDADLIEQKSKELFVLSDISEAKAADLTILAKYDNIVEFAEEVKPLLDELMCLENRDCTMSSELEKEVRVYLRAKSRETWES